MQRDDQAMQEGEPGDTVKKGHHLGTAIEAVLVRPPRLQCAARDVQHLGRLALGDSLGVQRAISFKQVSALAARPALVAIMIATVLCLDYRCHRLPPLPKPLPCENWRAKDGEVATGFQSLSASSPTFSRSSSR